MKRIFTILGIIVAMVAVFFFGRHTAEEKTQGYTTVKIDTVHYAVQVPVKETLLSYETVTLPVRNKPNTANKTYEPRMREGKPPDVLPEQAAPDICVVSTADSAVVEIPITQKIYEGDSYRAWVSGYKAQLDSIETYNTTTTIKLPKEIPKRWHIGITGGYGVTKQGMSPYIGIGITYSLISF